MKFILSLIVLPAALIFAADPKTNNINDFGTSGTGTNLDAGAINPSKAGEMQIEFANSLLKAAGKRAELRLVKELGHREAFRIQTAGGQTVIEADSPAGFIYGAQAVICDSQAGQVQKPDFDIRGTTLWLAGQVSGKGIAPYRSGFDATRLPWFFDRAFMTRYLEMLVAARYNTIFVWGSHPFPYILDLPDYPGATHLTPEQLRQNQEQFRWFTAECARRNIQVLLHFYNIHLPETLSAKFGARSLLGAATLTKPTPESARYYKYALARYFQEFENVGLYICPGETLKTQYQLEWFRDVIFAAARESGKNPLLVLRDWTMDEGFRAKIRELYENSYSELKHNDESFTSPVPDRRHELWRGVLKGHIVNLHGPPMDLQPMRWGSPVLIREAVGEWHKLGFFKGAEIYALSCFNWPVTEDKLEPTQEGYREQVKGPTLLWLDRDTIYLDAFGRYLWCGRPDEEAERTYWQNYLAQKFKSTEVGKLLYQWYVLTGPISPGIQNLTAVKFGNFRSTVLLLNQNVDQIIKARRHISYVKPDIKLGYGAYYTQPVDLGFFQRYQVRYALPALTERISMPIAQYALELEAGRTVTNAMTPDKVCDLLCELATESLAAARAAQQAGQATAAAEELGRFVSDSEMYVLVTEAFRHKVQAAILRVRMSKSRKADMAEAFLKHMEQSVAVYEKLAELTSRTYRHENEWMGNHWNKEGLDRFRKDLTAQQKWLETFLTGPGALKK